MILAEAPGRGACMVRVQVRLPTGNERTIAAASAIELLRPDVVNALAARSPHSLGAELEAQSNGPNGEGLKTKPYMNLTDGAVGD